MAARWILTITMGAALAAAAPLELAAQGGSQRGRQQQPQRMDAREAARRAAEREQLRREREQRDERARADERERARRQTEWERERDRERDRARNPRNGGRYDDWGVWGDNNRSRNGGPAFCRSGQGHPVFGRQWCRERGFGLGHERWEQDRWGDIVLRDRTRRHQQYNRASLAGILGSVWLNRFETHGRRFSSGPLYGFWLPESSGTVLQLMVGGIPIAQLVDYNRDGRVDNLLLRR